jgi:hypothetical protein
MADMSDFLVSSLVFGVILFFGCNIVADATTTAFLRDKFKSITQMFFSILCMGAFLLIFALFSISLNKALIYEPPPPTNLMFWGLDKNADCDYNQVNEFIKVTNSRVVLFGKAKSNAPPVMNVVGEAPGPMSDFESIRTWYKFNGEHDWNTVLVFGLSRRTTGNIGIYADFTSGTSYSARAYINSSDRVDWSGGLRGEVCNFETKNSSTSGRRPLSKPSNVFPGL